MAENMTSGNPELDSKIEEYIKFAGDLKTADDVKALCSERKYDELEKIMMNRLAFGTAGLRGRMGPGYNAMNDLVIIQTSQGLAAYFDSIIVRKEDKAKGIVIGYDNRYNSKRFSNLAAVSFILRGFKVYLYSSITPTPFVPFAVKNLKCLVGIMVTASHNPKDDNGYKVYWTNGAQILPPHDENIQKNILKNLCPWPDAFNTELVWTSPLVHDPLADIEYAYYRDLKEAMHDMEIFNSTALSVAFTAMHGVSHWFMKKAFQKLGFENYYPVEEQMYPDPDFPTVAFPNPEEKNSLDYSVLCAEKHGSSLILANDPDADRLAVAEKQANGKWHVFSGNEVGALLGSWLWKNVNSEEKKNPGNCCMISSTVSSKILRSIAAKEGFVYYETLTGFKWMANKAYECLESSSSDSESGGTSGHNIRPKGSARK